MEKYAELASEIIKKIGGSENVNSVFHCVTRLRFKLKDENAADTEALKNMDGVITVMQSGGQYQVVIGNHVTDVYQAVVKAGNFPAEDALDVDEGDVKTSLFNRFIDTVSGIFTPILGVLAATGMLKGFVAMFLAFGWLTKEMGTYQLLQAIGDSLFFFLPIFLGYSASKKFKGNIFIGMVIGASLVYPSLSGLTEGKVLYTLFAGTIIESPIYLTFLGIPVILMNYASSVIPIILAAYVAANVEGWLKTIIPDVVKTFLVPFCTVAIVAPLTFIIIGPIATWAGDILGVVSLAIYNFSPVFAGAFLGGFWQIFVMFGLHWGLVPLALINYATLGYDQILALAFGASFAQIGAVLAVVLKTKNKKLKGLGISAFISGIFGITEPAIYGITLPLKKPFIMSCIAASVSGALLGLFKSTTYMSGGLGIFGIPTRVHPDNGLDSAFWGTLLAISVAFILGFILTYLFGTKKENRLENL